MAFELNTTISSLGGAVVGGLIGSGAGFLFTERDSNKTFNATIFGIGGAALLGGLGFFVGQPTAAAYGHRRRATRRQRRNVKGSLTPLQRQRLGVVEFSHSGGRSRSFGRQSRSNVRMSSVLNSSMSRRTYF